MSSPIRERLLDELDRGEAAELSSFLEPLGLLEEPSERLGTAVHQRAALVAQAHAGRIEGVARSIDPDQQVPTRLDARVLSLARAHVAAARGDPSTVERAAGVFPFVEWGLGFLKENAFAFVALLASTLALGTAMLLEDAPAPSALAARVADPAERWAIVEVGAVPSPHPELARSVSSGARTGTVAERSIAEALAVGAQLGPLGADGALQVRRSKPVIGVRSLTTEGALRSAHVLDLLRAAELAPCAKPGVTTVTLSLEISREAAPRLTATGPEDPVVRCVAARILPRLAGKPSGRAWITLQLLAPNTDGQGH